MKLRQRWAFSPSAILISLYLSIGAVSDAQAMLITRLHYDADLDFVDAAVPGISPGMRVMGSFVFDRDEATNEYSPVTNFTLSVGNLEFTQNDVVSSEVLLWTSTGGITAYVGLLGRPGLGDWSDGVSLHLFQEYGDSNLFLFSWATSSSMRGHLGINLEPLATRPSDPIPEPSVFWLLVSGLPLVRSMHGTRPLLRGRAGAHLQTMES